MSDLRAFFENVLYHAVSPRRFTQQSPVMPDVWIRYGVEPGKQVELLMVPNWHYTTADLAQELKARLAENKDSGFKAGRFRSEKGKSPAVAHNQNVVVARLFFDELVRVVMPLSRWWLRSVSGMSGPGDPDRMAERMKTAESQRALVRDLARAMKGGKPRQVTPDTVWLARVVGLIALLSTAAERKNAPKSEAARVRRYQKLFEQHSKLAKVVIDLLKDLEPTYWDDDHPLYSVNRNRTTQAALNDSTGAVKADAASRVFKVTGGGIRWAVIDSGVDARHPAFRKMDSKGVPKRHAFKERKAKRRRGTRRAGGKRFRNQTRIVATYDFVRIRELLGMASDGFDDTSSAEYKALLARFPALKLKKNRDRLIKLVGDSEAHLIDWQKLEPFLRIPHDPESYRAPVNRHGTHVAGIMAAHWKGEPDQLPEEDDEPDEDEHADDLEDLYRTDGSLQGVAPEVELYDLRVLDDEGTGNEFAIMSALQFVRDLNNRKDFVAIHGVNLSFSIEHDVANYACGRTPVCDEANRLVGSGLTVIAAAGNSGRARYMTPAGLPDEGFRTVSITDPGNADAVITVGATHRRDPHTYGVSYFSSRGPTGDGRLKPDLVAPGEKIRSTIPEGGDDRLDGTSMAAPHVSGAAALIMARHFELIGQPQRIKEILCSTATDLGRERYFQGSGMLDILRALESI